MTNDSAYWAAGPLDSTGNYVNAERTRRARNSQSAQAQLKRRLQVFKDKGVVFGKDWRTIRPLAYTPHVGGPNALFGRRKNLQWLESGFDQFRWNWADKVATSIRHTGWFDSEYQDETYRGVVLRTTRGTLIPAIAHGSESRSGKLWRSACGNESALIIVRGAEFTADDSVACARAADGYAESMAEDEREYSDASSKAAEYEELRESIKSTRRETLESFAEMRRARGLLRKHDAQEAFPALCETLRANARAAARTIRQARKRMASIRDDYGNRQGFKDNVTA